MSMSVFQKRWRMTEFAADCLINGIQSWLGSFLVSHRSLARIDYFSLGLVWAELMREPWC